MRFSLRPRLSTRLGPRRIIAATLWVSRFLQWASNAIVVAIASYYIHQFHYRGEHLYYEEIIACSSLGFYFPLFVFATWRRLTWHVILLDLVYSHLWLTAFIFQAEDYNWQSCSVTPFASDNCKLKYTSEAFTFSSFYFTLFSGLVQVAVLIDERHIAKNDPAAQDPEMTGATNSGAVVAPEANPA